MYRSVPRYIYFAILGWRLQNFLSSKIHPDLLKIGDSIKINSPYHHFSTLNGLVPQQLVRVLPLPRAPSPALLSYMGRVLLLPRVPSATLSCPSGRALPIPRAPSPAMLRYPLGQVLLLPRVPSPKM